MTDIAVAAQRPFPLKRALALWALLAVLLVTVNLTNIYLRRFPDPDDMMRLLQVRDLLGGQAWFDLHQYRINPPDGTLMHWSRLVDIPIALVIGSLAPLFGAGGAENAALVLVPLFTLGVIVMTVAYVSSRLFGGDEIAFACLSLGLSPLFVAQVQPLRIDHHGWQIASVMIALVGLLPGRGARGAALAGAALAVGLTISLEVLPLLAAFGLVFGLRWLLADDRQPLLWFLGVLSACSGLLFLGTRSLSDTAVHCDQMSPPHALFLIVTTSLAILVAGFAPKGRSSRTALLAAVPVAGLAAFAWAAPECLAGPFDTLDPLVRSYWYENVLEGLPVWKIAPAFAVPVAIAGAISLGTLLHLARVRPPEERQWWLEYFLLALFAYLSALLVWRSQAFVGALAAVPVGWLVVKLFARLRGAQGWRERTAVILAVMLALTPGVATAMVRGLSSLLPHDVDVGEAAGVSHSQCEVDASAQKLDRLAPATIVTPLDIGPAIIERSHHTVLATGHHRSAVAMRDVVRAFTFPSAEAEQVVRRHGAGYLLLCTDLSEVQLYERRNPHGLTAGLLEGRTPAWLEPIELGTPSAFRVYRVRPPALTPVGNPAPRH